MAFPIPAHLPRKKDLDVSTTVLSKMSETSLKSLNHELASSWVSELETAIRQTKDRIHERVQADLPAFDRQLSSSKSVQQRLQTLSSNVDRLQDALSNPETGLVPTLIASLTRHASLAQDAADANALQEAMAYLAECKQEMRGLTELVESGRLPEAVEKYQKMEHLLAQRQPSLLGTEVYVDLQRRFRAAKDKADEQLNEAYSRSIIVNASEIIIRPSVQVRACETVLALPAVLASLSKTNLSNFMNTLRRDVTTHYVDFLLGQAASVELSSVSSIAGTMEHKLSVFPAPHGGELLGNRVDNVASVFSFLSDHLFPHLPPKAAFPITLSRPLSHALLDKLLRPSLPSSQQDLPAFLKLVQHAVKFENDFIRGVLGDESGGQDVKTWADSVGQHYEKKRRVQLLEQARALIIREDDGSSFRAEVLVVEDELLNGAQPPTDDSNWNFDDEGEAEKDGWGLDDEMEAEPLVQGPVTAASPEPEPSAVEEDVDDPWGLGDEGDGAVADNGDASTDSSAWDDPWGDAPEPIPAPKVTKAATRLERLSNKGKTKDTWSAIQSPVPVPPPPSTPAAPVLASVRQRLPLPKQQVEKESYLVSGRAKELFCLVENTLREASALASSNILPYNHNTSMSPVGTLIGQTSALILDLYRGLYPVSAASKLASPKWTLGFSNDCVWLHIELGKILSLDTLQTITRSKLAESHARLNLLSECWYDETLTQQIDHLYSVLDNTEAFVGTAEQERFDECEEAVSQVLQDVRKFARQVKPVLPKTKYYQAIGAVVNAALSRILQDVLALPDITEVESHKLNELCRILNALEGLFVEDPNHPSFVVAFVPQWLKFSYLSELLEASIADISYLFEEGALVDFDIDELVNIVRALFADTPLRTNTINKLLQGHPVQS